MSRKHKFLRKCIACGEFKDKSELIKITKNYLGNELVINNENSLYGRSAYVCDNKTCVESTLKKHKIEKVLKRNVNQDVNDFLKTVLER